MTTSANINLITLCEHSCLNNLSVIGKPGLLATSRGARVTISLNSVHGGVPRRTASYVAIIIGYLASYEDMGSLEVTLLAGCSTNASLATKLASATIHCSIKERVSIYTTFLLIGNLTSTCTQSRSTTQLFLTFISPVEGKVKLFDVTFAWASDSILVRRDVLNKSPRGSSPFRNTSSQDASLHDASLQNASYQNASMG